MVWQSQPLHADHGIARHDARELLLGQIVGVRRTHRQHEVAGLRAGVPHLDIDVVRDHRAHLGEQFPWFPHGPSAVRRRLVPLRWQPERRPRVARAQRADDQVVHVRGVLHHGHVLALRPAEAEIRHGGGPVRQQTRLVLRVGPRPGDDLGAVHRPQVVLEMRDDRVHRVDVEDPLLHEHRFDGRDARLDRCQYFGDVNRIE